MNLQFRGFFSRPVAEDFAHIGVGPESSSGRDVQTDRYGFEIAVRPKDVEYRQKCENKARRRAERWMPYEVSRILPKDAKVKELIRKVGSEPWMRFKEIGYLFVQGIPPGLRSWVWMETSEAGKLMESYGIGYYRQKLDEARESSPVAKQIELDVPRTFPDHAWFETLDGQKRLENVLLAYSMHNPVVGYCQSMNYIAAMFLLVMEKKEERAFFMMMALIERILFVGVYEPNLIGCQVEMKSLGELLQKKLPKLSKHLESMHCEMSLIATDWFLCLFCTSVPSDVAMRIWDCLFNEGPKILFRVSVAILLLAEKQLLKIDNPGEMLRAVKVYASHIHNRDSLMKVAFEKIGSLSKTTISRLRQTKKAEVEAMIALRSKKTFPRPASHESTKWDTIELEESVAQDLDERSSIATAMSGFSVDWKDFPDPDPDFEFGTRQLPPSTPDAAFSFRQ